MFCLRIALSVALVSVAAAAPAGEKLPPHPRLLLSAEGVIAMKQRIETCDWAKQDWLAMKKRLDATLAKKIELPPRGGNWTHWYACPEHGCRLTQGKQVGPWQWEHICGVDKAVLKSDPSEPSRDYDGCSIANFHRGTTQTMCDLGVAYQITGDRRYADKVREIALAYAQIYASYPLHTTKGKPEIGGGKAGSQTLDESVWLIPMCQGLDLVWDTISEQDRATIADKLLLPAAKDVILPHKMGIHNIQCWKNSAVGLVGLLLDDQALIRAAIDNPERGYRVQMSKGVLPEGGWWEGAWGYHFYTMSALWPLTEAARNCGIDLYGPEFKRMFDAPLRFAMPNLRLPAFSDSGETDVQGARGIYELAYARYKDPEYLRILAKSDRKHDYALLYGDAQLPPAPATEGKSANYPDAGYAILTKGKGNDATWLCMKYGPYGSGHGHPDKLGFVLYSRGQVIAIDPGTALYGLPQQLGWFKTSLAHNTLIVDEASQKAVDGKCVEFDADYIVADAGGIYEGVRYVRTAALLGTGLMLIIDQVTSDKERLLDIAYHQKGTWADLPSGSAWAKPDKPGYKYLENATQRALSGAQVLSTRIGDTDSVTVTVSSMQPAELITAGGITSYTQDRVPTAIVRRKGTESTVAWAISLDGKPATIERLAPLAKADGLQPIELRVTAADGRVWNVTVNPDKLSEVCSGAACHIEAEAK